MVFKEIEDPQHGISEPTIDQFSVTYEFTLDGAHIIDGVYQVTVYNSYGESTNDTIYIGDDINVDFTDLFFICKEHGVIPIEQISEDANTIVVKLKLDECISGEVITLCTGYDLAEPGHWFEEVPFDPHTSDVKANITLLSPIGGQSDISEGQKIKCRNDSIGLASTWHWDVYLETTDNRIASFGAVNEIEYMPSAPGNYFVVLSVWDMKDTMAQDTEKILITSRDSFFVTVSVDYPAPVNLGGAIRYICKLGETMTAHATAPSDITSSKWIVQYIKPDGGYEVVKVINNTLNLSYKATKEGSYQIKFYAWRSDQSRSRSVIIEVRDKKFELFLDFIILKPKLNSELVFRDTFKCQNISNKTLHDMRWEVYFTETNGSKTLVYTEAIPTATNFGSILQYKPLNLGVYTVVLYGTDAAGIEGKKQKTITVGYPPLVAQFDITSHTSYQVSQSPSREIYDVYWLNPNDPAYNPDTDPTKIICDQTCDCFPESFEWKVVERGFGAGNRTFTAIGPGLEYTIETDSESILDIYLRVKRGAEYSDWVRKRIHVYPDRNTKAVAGRGKTCIFDMILNSPIAGDKTEITKVAIAGKVAVFPYSPGAQASATSPANLMNLIRATSPCIRIDISSGEAFNSGAIVYTKNVTNPLTDTFSYLPTVSGPYTIRLTVLTPTITDWYFNRYADITLYAIPIPSLTGDFVVVYPYNVNYGLVNAEDLLCVNNSSDCDTVTWSIRPQDSVLRSFPEFNDQDVLYLPECGSLKPLQVHDAVWTIMIALKKTYPSGYVANVTNAKTVRWKDLKTCNYLWEWDNPVDLKATNPRWVVGVFPRDMISMQCSIPNALPYECVFEYEWNVYWGISPYHDHSPVMVGAVNKSGAVMFTPDTYGHYIISLRVYVKDLLGNTIGYSYALTDEFYAELFYPYPYHYIKIAGGVENQTAALKSDMYIQVNNQSFLTYVIKDTDKSYKLKWDYAYTDGNSSIVRASDAVYVNLQNDLYSNQWDFNFIDMGVYTVTLSLFEVVDGVYVEPAISKYSIKIDATPVKLNDGYTVRLQSLEVPYEDYPTLAKPLTYTEHIEGIDTVNTSYALGHFINDRLYPMVFPYLTNKTGKSVVTAAQSIPGLTFVWDVHLTEDLYASSATMDPNGDVSVTGKSAMLLHATTAHQTNDQTYFRFHYPRMICRNLTYTGSIHVQATDSRYGKTTVSEVTVPVRIVITTDTYFGSSKILFNVSQLHNIYGSQSLLHKTLLKPKAVNYCFNEGPYSLDVNNRTGISVDGALIYEGMPNPVMVKYNQGPKSAHVGKNMYYKLTTEVWTNSGLKSRYVSDKMQCLAGENVKISPYIVEDLNLTGSEVNAYILVTITYYYQNTITKTYTSPRYPIRKMKVMNGLNQAGYNADQASRGYQIEFPVLQYTVTDSSLGSVIYDGLKINSEIDPCLVNTSMIPSVRCNASLPIPNSVSKYGWYYGFYLNDIWWPGVSSDAYIKSLRNLLYRKCNPEGFYPAFGDLWGTAVSPGLTYGYMYEFNDRSYYFGSTRSPGELRDGARMDIGPESAKYTYLTSPSPVSSSNQLLPESAPDTLSYTITTKSLSPGLFDTVISIGCMKLTNGIPYWYSVTGCTPYIDSLRISNIARYNGEFTSPSVAFDVDANVLVNIPFNGNLQDTSSYNRTISSFDTPVYATGKFDRCFTLSRGSTQYLSIPYDASLAFTSSDFTIEFWFRQDGSGNGTYYLYSHDTQTWNTNHTIRVDASGSAYMVTWALRNDTTDLASMSISLLTGLWYHIACVKKGDVCTLYVNGSVKSTGTIPQTIFPTSITMAKRPDADWRQLSSIPYLKQGMNVANEFLTARGYTGIQSTESYIIDSTSAISVRTTKLPFYLYAYNSSTSRNNITVTSANKSVTIANPVTNQLTYIGTVGDGWIMQASIDPTTLWDLHSGLRITSDMISSAIWKVTVDGTVLTTSPASDITDPFTFKSSASDGPHFYVVSLTLTGTTGIVYPEITFAFKAYHVADYDSLSEEEGDPAEDDITIDPTTTIYADFDSGRKVIVASTREEASSGPQYPIYLKSLYTNGQVAEADVNYIRFYLSPPLQAKKAGSVTVENITTTIEDEDGNVEITLPTKYYIKDEQTPYGEFSYYVMLPQVIAAIGPYLHTSFDLKITHDNGEVETIRYGGYVYITFSQNNPNSVADPYVNALSPDNLTEEAYKLTIPGSPFTYTYDGVTETVVQPSVEVYISSPDCEMEFSQNEYGLDICSIKYSIAKPKDIAIVVRAVKTCFADTQLNQSIHFYQTHQWGLVTWSGNDAVPSEGSLPVGQKAIKPYEKGYGLYCTYCGKLTKFTCSSNKIMIPDPTMYQDDPTTTVYAASIKKKYPNICYEDQFTTAANPAKIAPIYVGLINSSEFNPSDGNYSGLIGTRIVDGVGNVIGTFTSQFGKSTTLYNELQQPYASPPHYLLKIEFEQVNMTKLTTS